MPEDAPTIEINMRLIHTRIDKSDGGIAIAGKSGGIARESGLPDDPYARSLSCFVELCVTALRLIEQHQFFAKHSGDGGNFAERNAAVPAIRNCFVDVSDF